MRRKLMTTMRSFRVGGEVLTVEKRTVLLGEGGRRGEFFAVENGVGERGGREIWGALLTLKKAPFGKGRGA